MKKILRKFAVLVFAVMLFSIPISEAYAATVPVIDIDAPDIGLKVYKYNVIEYSEGLSTLLYDPTTSDQTIPVPAGKSFQLQIITNAYDNAHNLQVTLYTNSGVKYNEVLTTTNGGFMVDIPPQSSDMRYTVCLNALILDVTIYSFATFIR